MREFETEQNLKKDLFNRASHMSQSSGEGKLNEFPSCGTSFNGKATEYIEYNSRWRPT